MEIQALFTQNLKKYRKQAKLTQEKLAELCGTDFRYIGQIETGRRCPSLDFVGKIASALNVAPYRLFYDKNDTAINGFETLHKDQKQKIKAIIIENATRTCSIIDEQC
ncbi:MAG: helix-turn-helix domain-containing protein [Treponema sp.]|jgi:transcriptional regulator with XRE-family HTH domain|nr:helix-turn-helix domain-containing protein [Treponema sp.]